MTGREAGCWSLGAAALLAMAAVAGRPGPAAGGPPQVAAHRGGALLWPENSLRAFRGALALGADWLEADVHLTADGEVVVLHDATLDRTTTGRGPVGAVRRADLGGVELRDGRGAATGEPVPRLADLLDLLAPGRAGLLLEIKTDAAGRRYAGIEDRAVALLRSRTLAGRTRVMAFEPATLARVRQLDPGLATVLLVGRDQARQAGSAAAAVAGAGPAGHVGVDHRLLDREVVEAARRAGRGLAAWTVNEEADLRRVIALGVDIVITDRPDLALRLLGR